MKKYRNYTDQDIIDKAKYVTSLSQLLQELDLRPAGGNFENMKKNLNRLNVDTKHWTGQAWSLDKQLKNSSDYLIARSVKKHLIIKRGHKCEGKDCGLTKWRNLPIILELEHKDGNRTNNEEENLELLCPNCHSQTPHWRGRKSNINW